MPPSPTRLRTQGTLYHASVPSPCGDHLLPLNEMRTRYPDLHRRHHAKYRDREGVLLQPVSPLGCTWGDVIFFSPVDSRQLFEAIRESGRAVHEPRSWTINAARLDPARTCIRLMRKSATGPDAEPATPDDFLPFTTGILRAVALRWPPHRQLCLRDVCSTPAAHGPGSTGIA
jgi:hypothetical protein